jgi:hypothetical protein
MRYDFVGWTIAIISFIYKRNHHIDKFNPDYIPTIPKGKGIDTNIEGVNNTTT